MQKFLILSQALGLTSAILQRTGLNQDPAAAPAEGADAAAAAPAAAGEGAAAAGTETVHPVHAPLVRENGQKCDPVCSWKCDDPVCEESCSPVCAAPTCKTFCETFSPDLCTTTCPEPKCNVICPHSCTNGGCANCKTVCKQPECKTTCVNDCVSKCADPVCSWKCDKPVQCSKPTCQMSCQQCADPFAKGDGSSVVLPWKDARVMSAGQAQLATGGALSEANITAGQAFFQLAW